MSTTGLMNVGTRAMFAAQTQLTTTGHNIANANVAGYSRQEANLTTTAGQYTGAGYIGRGVSVQSVTRAVDGFLTDQVAQTKALAAADSTRSDMLSRLQNAFGSGEQGLGYAATQLFNGFSDVAASPADPSARQVVLSRAEELASRFRSSSDQIESLQASVTQDVATGVDTVNGLAKRVAALNDQIAGAAGGSNAPNDLLDQRDQLVNQISEQVQVTRLLQSDGSLNLFIGAGQSLVLGNNAYALVARPDGFDPSRTQVNVSVAGVERPLNEQALGGGALAGLIGFQNTDIAAARDQLGQLAATLAGQINQQQSLGMDLKGNTGSNLSAVFTVGAPNAIPASSNATSSNNYVGSVGLTISDTTKLQASEYEMRVNADGTFNVQRRSDGQTWANQADGATIDGFQIHIGSAPAAGDRFLLQPVSTAAQGMARALSDPAGLAAANPVLAVANPANTGTASVRSLTINSAPTTPYAALTLSFGAPSAAGRNYQLLDSTGASVGSGTWSAGTPIQVNGMSVKLDGVPASGDTFALNPTQFAQSSNGNALAFQGLGDAGMVLGKRFTDAYAQTMADIGVRVQSAASASTVSAGVADQAQAQLGSSTGVNLDEEAARLIQYQQSYQAAAKILQVAQKVFDTVLSIGGA
ncbi:MAG: flagellar hook-associated protein FlgK [Leptothrix sp. (in: b-proteobacteria)]